MNFIDITKEKLNRAFTENNDLAYATTSSACLDYFALIGAKRFDLDGAFACFIKAFYEDKLLAIKILFYTRDIKHGLGERNLFRYTFNALCNFYPSIAKQLLNYIPIYGRYDDLLVALNTPVENDMVKLIQKQLEIDIENKKNNKPISLLAKWLPSINTSSSETRMMANRLINLLNIDKKSYRQLLAFLRKDIIIENNLRLKDYTFNYENVPSCAMFLYKNAFLRNDEKRYSEYLDDLACNKKTINSQVLYPYQIVREIFNKKSIDSANRKVLNLTWKELVGKTDDSKTLVVRDGSGSMYDGFNPSANDVASSLTILFAEKLTGLFHNKFITFSSRPKLVEFKDIQDIVDKCNFLMNYDDCSNTNIEKVYNLIIDIYKDKNFNKEDALDRIVIISDMEFDECSNVKLSTFEKFKKDFATIGYQMPQLVFFNVRARHMTLPVTKNEKGVILVSGSSKNIIDIITSNESFDPYDFMIKTLAKYNCFNTIKL